MTPSILSGNRQAPPGATLKTPAELMPKVDNVPAIGHSGAFCANETDTNLGPRGQQPNQLPLIRA